ncbi:MAG: response regulator [Proteobacteria bacterium]|nr:response regulator [Pseudomonadota bacterium]
MEINDYILLHTTGNLYWKSTNKTYLGCNLEFSELIGLKSPQEIIGKSDKDLFLDNLGIDFIGKLEETDECVFQGTEQLVEETGLDKTGALAYYLTKKTPLKDSKNNIIGLIGSSLNITERKKMENDLLCAKEAAESSNKAKSEFIANMSHDLRTPITGILGLAQELLYQTEDIQAPLNELHHEHTSVADNQSLSLLSEFIETVKENSGLLMGTTDELLQFCNEILETSRLDSGHGSANNESFNVRELVEHNIELLQSAAHHKKLFLHYEIDEQIPVYLHGLREYLDRTLLNLLSNALKFTEQGGVTLQLNLLNPAQSPYQPGDTIELEIVVEDSGIGIPSDKFETIFEHFSRLTSSYEGIYKGSGLGLYTVKRYVDAMKATIRVESTVGEGSRFIIKAPWIVCNHADRIKSSVRLPKPLLVPAPEPVTSNKLQAQIPATAPRVLVVEDNPLAARAVNSLLTRLDCVADTAQTGREAIQKVQEKEYDLILMDIGLPDIDGIEVTRQIRALNLQKTAQIPIVALTGHANDTQKREESFAAGIQDVVSKPIAQSLLSAILKQYVLDPRQNDALSPDAPEHDDVGMDADIIDWKACLQQLNGDKTLLMELLSLLASDFKAAKETLKKAYAAHDNNALRAELHRVSGGLSYLTLPQVNKALSDFHEAVKATPQEMHHLEYTYNQLLHHIQLFCMALEKKPSQ